MSHGTLRGGLGVCVIAASAAFGAVATIVTRAQPGLALGLFVLAGTVAAALTIEPRAGRLIFPVPALAYLAAALLSGLAYNHSTDQAELAVGAAQWIANGFFVMVLATLLAIALTTVRWLLWRRSGQVPLATDWPAEASTGRPASTGHRGGAGRPASTGHPAANGHPATAGRPDSTGHPDSTGRPGGAGRPGGTDGWGDPRSAGPRPAPGLPPHLQPGSEPGTRPSQPGGRGPAPRPGPSFTPNPPPGPDRAQYQRPGSGRTGPGPYNFSSGA
jgi:hypothetical protein